MLLSLGLSPYRCLLSNWSRTKSGYIILLALNLNPKSLWLRQIRGRTRASKLSVEQCLVHVRNHVWWLDKREREAWPSHETWRRSSCITQFEFYAGEKAAQSMSSSKRLNTNWFSLLRFTLSNFCLLCILSPSPAPSMQNIFNHKNIFCIFRGAPLDQFLQVHLCPRNIVQLHIA